MKTTMLAFGRLLGLWLWLAALCWNLNPVWATTITVNNTNDNVAGSLRRAIQDAGSGDTINFSVTGVITLTNGELLLTKNLTIIGPGATNLAVSGNNRSRLFEIVSTVSADVSGLMLRDGNSDRGGGVYNSGSLTMISCVAEGNFGSGVYNGGTLTLLGCTVSNNTALGNGGPGGGIYNVGTLTLSTCTVRGNSGSLGSFGTPGGIGRGGCH